MFQNQITRMWVLFTISSLLPSIFFISFSPAWANPKTIVGHWEGAYGREGSIQPVMLDFILEDGNLLGTYDVPELEIYGEPIREIEQNYPSLSIRLTYGVFTMHVSDDIGEMTGENKKWGPPLTLHLKRLPKPTITRFPREEIQFNNGPISVVGTLVMPPTAGPYPVFIVIHGSGVQGRDVGYYSIWGDFFARHRLAALIFDKRGVRA